MSLPALGFGATSRSPSGFDWCGLGGDVAISSCLRIYGVCRTARSGWDVRNDATAM